MDENIELYRSLGGEIASSAIELPPPDTKRWVTRRKAVIVNAVRTGVISLEEVCRRYELSVEEFLAWQRAINTMECRVYASPGSKSIATTRPLG
jgi:Protein of unknown function (DUF1153)